MMDCTADYDSAHSGWLDRRILRGRILNHLNAPE